MYVIFKKVIFTLCNFRVAKGWTISGKFPETLQEDSKKIPESFRNLLKMFQLYATLRKARAITYALFDPSMFIFCFQRSEIQQNQGFTARILQTIKKPQYTVSV